MTIPVTWFGWAVLAAVFAALTAIFAKVGVHKVDADLATWIRTVVIVMPLTVFVWATGKWSNPFAIPAMTWLFLVLSGFASVASWVCYFRALKLGDVSKIAPIDKSSIVLIALFAFVFLGERPAAREWIGVAMVACGVLVLASRR